MGDTVQGGLEDCHIPEVMMNIDGKSCSGRNVSMDAIVCYLFYIRDIGMGYVHADD